MALSHDALACAEVYSYLQSRLACNGAASQLAWESACRAMMLLAPPPGKVGFQQLGASPALGRQPASTNSGGQVATAPAIPAAAAGKVDSSMSVSTATLAQTSSNSIVEASSAASSAGSSSSSSSDNHSPTSASTDGEDACVDASPAASLSATVPAAASATPAAARAAAPAAPSVSPVPLTKPVQLPQQPVRARATSRAGGSQKLPENTGRWSRREHETFLVGLQRYGRQWTRIARLVHTRTGLQTRTHAQKYFKKLAKDDYDVDAIHAMLKTKHLSGETGVYSASEIRLPGLPDSRRQAVLLDPRHPEIVAYYESVAKRSTEQAQAAERLAGDSVDTAGAGAAASMAMCSEGSEDGDAHGSEDGVAVGSSRKRSGSGMGSTTSSGRGGKKAKPGGGEYEELAARVLLGLVSASDDSGDDDDDSFAA